MACTQLLLLLQLLVSSSSFPQAELPGGAQVGDHLPPQDTVSLIQVSEKPSARGVGVRLPFGRFTRGGGDGEKSLRATPSSAPLDSEKVAAVRQEPPTVQEEAVQEQESKPAEKDNTGEADVKEKDEEEEDEEEAKEAQVEAKPARNVKTQQSEDSNIVEKLTALKEEKEETVPLGERGPLPTDVPANADPEQIQLKELHDKLVAEMREKIRVEADQRVKQKMAAKYAARQKELKQLKAEEQARQEQQAAAKLEQKRLEEEQAKEKKRVLEREKAERHQSYLIAQQMKLEAEKESIRKKQAAAARLAELEEKQARKREEQEEPWQETKAEEVPPENAQSLNLRLRDGLNREIVVKVNKGGHLRPMMNVACQRFGLDRSHVLFSFNGEQVGSFDTPETMALENGDVLTVLEQEGVVKEKPVDQVRTERVKAAAVADEPQEIREVTEEEATRAVEESLHPANAISVEDEAKAFHAAKDAILEALHQINVDVVGWLKKTDRAWPISFMSAVDRRSKAMGLSKTAQHTVFKDAKTFAATKVSTLREDLWAYVRQCKDEVKSDMDQMAEVGTLSRKKREVELTTAMVRKVRKWMEEVDESFEKQFEEWWSKQAH